MSLPKVEEVIDIYRQRTPTDIGQSAHRLFQRYGTEPLVSLLTQAYPSVPRSNGRSAILFSLVRYARARQDVVALATSALSDRSYLVREYACSILAYSLSQNAVPALEAATVHRDLKTRADASAALDAIAHKNHHYYVDREHSGSTFWVVNPSDAPGL